MKKLHRYYPAAMAVVAVAAAVAGDADLVVATKVAAMTLAELNIPTEVAAVAANNPF